MLIYLFLAQISLKKLMHEIRISFHSSVLFSRGLRIIDLFRSERNTRERERDREIVQMQDVLSRFLGEKERKVECRKQKECERKEERETRY